MFKGYIYLITNNITKKQYVGQTRQTIKKRFYQHCYDANKMTSNMYIHKSIRKYGKEYFSIEELKCIECSNKKELICNLNSLEKYYINLYHTEIPNGYNLSSGGNATPNYLTCKVDEYELNGTFVRTHNSLQDAALSVGTVYNCAILKCCKGKSKFAFQRIWRYHGEPFNKFPIPSLSIADREYKRTPVDQYSIDGKYIQSFSSASEAIESISNSSINSKHIPECCNGKLNTAYGYVWRFKGEPFNKYTNKDNRLSSCSQYSMNNEYIRSFNSVTEACKYIGKDPNISRTSIISCCAGRQKSAYGYIWKLNN